MALKESAWSPKAAFQIGGAEGQELTHGRVWKRCGRSGGRLSEPS